MEKKENYELKLTGQFEQADDGFKELLKEVCVEIDTFDGEFPFKVWQLALMPCELAMLIVDNLKFKNVYRETLQTIYYDEFKKDIKGKQENKKSKFENRQLAQKSLDYGLFGLERLLTLGEVENLIYAYILDEKLSFSKEDFLSGKIKTDDKKLKILLNAHKYLSEKENLEITNKIMRQLDKIWLELARDEIRNHRKEKGLGT